jgi:hypothetical protein
VAVRKISTQWSEAKHLRPGVHPSDEIVEAGYQRIPGIQLLGENDLHGLAAESVADFIAPVPVVVSAWFAGP